MALVPTQRWVCPSLSLHTSWLMSAIGRRWKRRCISCHGLLCVSRTASERIRRWEERMIWVCTGHDGISSTRRIWTWTWGLSPPPIFWVGITRQIPWGPAKINRDMKRKPGFRRGSHMRALSALGSFLHGNGAGVFVSVHAARSSLRRAHWMIRRSCGCRYFAA